MLSWRAAKFRWPISVTQWTHDGLVMDKWFILQGKNTAENALENVRATMSHAAFDLKNPNRTRSLVASFCAN